MVNKLVKYLGWFLFVICVFYTVGSIMYKQGWSKNDPDLLDASYKAIGFSVGLLVYFLWFKKRKATKKI